MRLVAGRKDPPSVSGEPLLDDEHVLNPPDGIGSGWAGTYFFMDPTTGLAGVYGTQLNGTVSGSRDPENLKAFTAFEETLYAGLA
jgi:hypothetical protein